MRTFKRRQPHALPFRSLLVVTAAAFVLTGFIVPKADAVVVAYFNFQDPAVGPDTSPDLVPGVTQTLPPFLVGDNPGGGREATVTLLTITTPGNQAGTPGLTLNRTPGDSDTATPGGALLLNRDIQGPATIAFGVNLQFYAGLSLSYACSLNGNAYANVQLSWTGAVTGSLPVQGTASGIVSFNLHGTNLDGNGTFKFVTFTMTFTNGQSNGNDLQNVIDNIRLDADIVVPEPATVWGGLLGVLGLCWFQRRRVIRSVRLLRT